MKWRLLAISLAATSALSGLALVLADTTPARHSITLVSSTIERVFSGRVPGGLRINATYSGTVTSGFLEGATAEPTDGAPSRPGGIIVVDIRGHVVTPEEPPISTGLQGYGMLPAPLTLESLLDPALETPDLDVVVHGIVWFATMAPRHAFLDHTASTCTGPPSWPRASCGSRTPPCSLEYVSRAGTDRPRQRPRGRVARKPHHLPRRIDPGSAAQGPEPPTNHHREPRRGRGSSLTAGAGSDGAQPRSERYMRRKRLMRSCRGGCVANQPLAFSRPTGLVKNMWATPSDTCIGDPL